MKFIFGFLVILAISIAVLFIASNSQKNDDYDRQTQLAKEMEEKYKNDTYGGDTPEQTLQLFIDALKAGNIDLASKYFVADKQEEWREKLGKIHENNLLDNMIGDLNRQKDRDEINGQQINFYIYNDNNILAVAIRMSKNIFSNKWKIESL